MDILLLVSFMLVRSRLATWIHSSKALRYQGDPNRLPPGCPSVLEPCRKQPGSGRSAAVIQGASMSSSLDASQARSGSPEHGAQAWLRASQSFTRASAIYVWQKGLPAAILVLQRTLKHMLVAATELVRSVRLQAPLVATEVTQRIQHLISWIRYTAGSSRSLHAIASFFRGLLSISTVSDTVYAPRRQLLSCQILFGLVR